MFLWQTYPTELHLKGWGPVIWNEVECFPRYTTKERKAGAKLWLSNTKQGERKSICTYLCGHKLILRGKSETLVTMALPLGREIKGSRSGRKLFFLFDYIIYLNYFNEKGKRKKLIYLRPLFSTHLANQQRYIYKGLCSYKKEGYLLGKDGGILGAFFPPKK